MLQTEQSSIVNRESSIAGEIAPFSQARCIAIVLPSWIGDSVMATPVLRALRATLPSVKLIGVMRRGLDDILRGNPWLDEMIVCEMKGALGPLRMGKAIRECGADAALLLPNSFRSAAGARFSGAKIRVGYDRDHRGWLLTHRCKAPDAGVPISAVDYYADLAEFAIGSPVTDRRIELAVTEEERRAADELLRGVQSPFVLLNPGANRPDKRWPAERFAQVADRLAASHRIGVVVNGSPNETDVLDAVTGSAKTSIINLAQRKSTLSSLKGVIARAALVITNDTGPRHIAAALGTPVVTLFGPTDHRWTTLYDVRERVLLAEPFLPQELMADRHAKACEIEKIAVMDVVRAAEDLLAESKSMVR